MKKATITLSCDEEKLAALRLYLGQRGTQLEEEWTKALDVLYEKKSVPAGVRNFLEMRSGDTAPAPRPKRKNIPVAEEAESQTENDANAPVRRFPRQGRARIPRRRNRANLRPVCRRENRREIGRNLQKSGENASSDLVAGISVGVVNDLRRGPQRTATPTAQGILASFRLGVRKRPIFARWGQRCKVCRQHKAFHRRCGTKTAKFMPEGRSKSG